MVTAGVKDRGANVEKTQCRAIYVEGKARAQATGEEIFTWAKAFRPSERPLMVLKVDGHVVSEAKAEGV